jgi:hypothetical protein
MVILKFTAALTLPVHTGQRTGWAPVAVWVIWRRQKKSLLSEIHPWPPRRSSRPSVSLGWQSQLQNE